MPLVAGFASSHAPAMFEPVERWPTIYDRIPADMKAAQPARARLETPERRVQLKARIVENFARVASVIVEARLDALIIIGDDQNDMFDSANIPALSMYVGAEMWGLSGTAYTPPDEREKVTFQCDDQLGEWLLAELVKAHFDVACSRDFLPRGAPEDGVSHMVAHIVPAVLGTAGPPVVPLFLNEYFPPLPTGGRCVELGRALGRILARTPKRVGIYASGGMSHDPIGPRAGWIDDRLDRWVMDRVVDNDVDALGHLFDVDSDTLDGGTAELRAWIVAAAAMDRPGEVVDYVAVHHAKTGLGWVTWPAKD